MNNKARNLMNQLDKLYSKRSNLNCKISKLQKESIDLSKEIDLKMFQYEQELTK